MSPENEATNSDQFARLAKVTGALKNWRPAAEVLTKVRSVPTIFPQFDRATNVGGCPIERPLFVHGPPGEGKTTWVHGLGLSFLERGHIYGFIDAEYTTPETWLQQLMGDYASHPGFTAIRPTSYEQTVDSVRELVETVGNAREKGDIDAQTTALLVVDSIRKLVPENFMAKIAKEGARGKKGSVDGFQGMGAMVKAKMNAEWLDELTPMLYRTGTALMIIGRETRKRGAKDWEKRAEQDYNITGGDALIFDTSLGVRITRDDWIRDGNDYKDPVVGERVKVRIWRTKVAGKDDRVVDSFFHTSNGVLRPEGFWRSWDVLDLARLYDIVSHTGGGWLKWGTYKKWQGERNAIKWLDAHPDEIEKLEGECRDEFEADDLEKQIESIAKPEEA